MTYITIAETSDKVFGNARVGITERKEKISEG